MREFLSILIMPVPLFFLLIIAGFLLLWRKRRRVGKVLLLFAGCWLLIISTRPVPRLLVENLEKRYSQLSDSVINSLHGSINIIVLGGGHSDDPALSLNSQLSEMALERLVEGIRIFKGAEAQNRRGADKNDSGNERLRDEGTKDRGRNCAECHNQLIVSGYGGRSKISQALVMKRTAIMLSIDSSHIKMSLFPSNTREEAAQYVGLFGTKTPLVVVTSAIHMPRAVMLFEKAGVKVIPAPTDFLIKRGSVKDRWGWMPSAGNIQMMEAAIHEYVGIVWAKVGGD
jgi:uncharacterized SAM-binding protein YcdF (DUF218 family)